VERRGDVVVLTLRRPTKRNALTAGMYTELSHQLESCDESGVGAVVLTGSGGSFTAGTDLTELRDTDPAVTTRFLLAVHRLPVPLIAAVDGPALGVGTTLLLHCDLVLATPRSVLGLPFVDLGLVPEAAATLLLPLRVGTGRATRLALLGERIDAATALAWQLVDEVCTDEAALAARAMELAAALAAKPRAALRSARALLRADGGAVERRLEEDADALLALLAAGAGAGLTISTARG